jgi:cleavage and polyadenylation specificity factor subunit 3
MSLFSPPAGSTPGTARKGPEKAAEDAQSTMVILPLGGGQEVGRSCILLQYHGRNILLDCGIHPGREGMDACPFFDLIEPADIDIILVTHFHLDHCASLPYFTEKTDFKGRVFMTHATKAVMRLLISDYIKLQFSGSKNNNNALFDDEDLLSCINKCETINFHQTIEHKGVKFTPSVAGHVLGAAVFTIDIDGVVVVYTGDYSMEEDRHLAPADIPVLGSSPDVLIVESTYGTQVHPSRAEREYRFTKTAEDIVSRGGHALVPVFALGRAQELLLLLEEHWKKNIHLQQFPIYYASKVAAKALRLYQTFINSMNVNVQKQLDVGNPFKFKHIENINRLDTAHLGPCVVVAAPGMLQNGVSRQLFELWCEDARNGVLLAGYSVEGTLGKRLLQEPKQIACLDGRIKDRNCTVEYVSFSAHVDYVQNWSFIKRVTPDNIILVHGEKSEMGRLKVELDREVSRGRIGYVCMYIMYVYACVYVMYVYVYMYVYM